MNDIFDINDFDPAKCMFIDASAGTGKTYTIQQIVGKLVTGDSVHGVAAVPLEKILIVTFTEKAAEELRDRIRSKLIEINSPESCKIDEASIYTIHSFCQNALSEFAFTANKTFNLDLIPDSEIEPFAEKWVRDVACSDEIFLNWVKFSPYGGSSLLSSVATELSVLFKKFYLTEKFEEDPSIISLDSEFLYKKWAKLEKHISFDEAIDILNKGIDDEMDETEEKCFVAMFSNFSAGQHVKKVVAFLTKYFAIKFLFDFYKAWTKEKAFRKVQTYDDMIRSVRESVLEENSDFKRKLQEKYSYAIIDEFQDTNQLQWDIFRSIFIDDSAVSPHSIYVVGDPKQSIYAFQGSDVNVYLKATRDDIGINSCGNGYRLDTNYRSTDEMVEACNRLFEGDFFKDSGGIEFSPSKASHKKLTSMYMGEPISPVLFGWHDENLILESEEDFMGLSSWEYASQVVSKIVDFCTFEEYDGEVKTRLQIHGVDKDGNAVLRNVSFSDFAVLARTSSEMYEIESCLKDSGVPFQRYKDKNLFAETECAHWISLFRAIEARDFSSYNRKLLSEALYTKFFDVPLVYVNSKDFDDPACKERRAFIKWRSLADKGEWAQLIESIYQESGIEGRLSELDKIQSLTKLRQIGNYAVSYLYSNNATLDDLIKNLVDLSAGSSGSEDNGTLVEKGTDFESVKIMTIHASKGLDFPIVISVAGFKGKYTPGSVFKYHVNGGNLKVGYNDGAKDAFIKDLLNEWRRIHYVAYTRAVSMMILPIYMDWSCKKIATEIAFLYNSIKAFLANKSELTASNGEKVFPFASLYSSDYFDPETNKQKVISILDEWEKRSSAKGSGSDIDRKEQEKRIRLLSGLAKDLRISKHSYSSMSHGKSSGNYSRDDGGWENDETGSERENLSVYDTEGISCTEYSLGPVEIDKYSKDFPGGTGLGCAIHEVFEKADFIAFSNMDSVEAAWDSKDLNALISDCFSKQGFSMAEKKDWVSQSGAYVWNTLRGQTPVVVGSSVKNEKFRLCDLKQEQRLSEVEFNLNPDEDPDGIFKRFCNGFVDLIFVREVDGEKVYSILDWKSDVKAPEVYGDSKLLGHEVDECYSIQRVLYSYCLIKWLKQFKSYSDLDFEEIFQKHFGGIYYVYLRGCEAGTPKGFYAHTWKNWASLEKAFFKIRNEKMF